MKKNIVFVITRVSLLGNFEGIYREFEKDPNFQPIFFIAGEPVSHQSIINPIEYYKKFPKQSLYPTHTFEAIKNACEKKQYNYVLGLDEKYDYNYIEDLNPEIVFYCDLYDHYYLKKEWSHSNIYKNYKTVYMHYGYLLTDLTVNMYESPVFSNSWKFFVESKDHLKLAEYKLGKVPKNFDYKGYPKLDPYYDEVNENIELPEILKDKKFLIYAPHWTIDVDSNNKKTGFGNFLDIYLEVLEMIKSSTDIYWIFRPHPLLKAQLDFVLGENEADAIYNKFFELSNLYYYEGEDIIQLFMESEGIVLDSVSFMAEYLPSLKPIFFLDSGNSELFNFIGKNIYEVTYHMDSIAEVSEMISEVVTNKNDFKYSNRFELAQKLLYLPTDELKKPSELIYEQIIEDLEKDS